MKDMHNLLRRQLKKQFGEAFIVPEQWRQFVHAVNDAYVQSDNDRSMLERSLDLSSQELLEANRDLKSILSVLNATIESTTDGILVVDLYGKIISFNRKFIDMWNMPLNIIETRNDEKAIQYVIDQLKEPDDFINKVKELYTNPNEESYDVLKFKDGRIFERFSKPQKIEGKCVGRVWSFRDVTERLKTEEQIATMAYFDLLTGLPNRYLMKDRLNQAKLYAEKHKKLLAVIFFDLDNFKRINDTFGHNVGDELLRKVSDRLEKNIRKIDTLSRSGNERMKATVARLGGDEFTILLREIKEVQDASRVAQRILELLSEPFAVMNREIYISASIGISLYPNDGEDADTLLKNADTAMYHAKENGKNTFKFFTDSMNLAAIERFTLENGLRKAQEKGELHLYYQPQFDLITHKIIGIEALIRWMHPEKGILLPDIFIKLAEDSGLIIPIGEWILKTACKQNKAWQIAGYDPIYVTVNISAVQFKQNNFVESVEHALTDADLKPEYLELELTESILMQPTDTAMKTLNELKARGVRLAIDDFGTGYSSFGYLKQLPIDTLKIDRSFVRDIELDHDDRAIIKAMISLARTLNLKVIAEGVETREQLAYLQEQGSDGIQGFLLSYPLPTDSLTELLKEERKSHHINYSAS